LAKPGFRPESSAGSHPNHFGTEILDIIEEQTGRAAKRLAELTGHEACTVHRLLDADLVVVDEDLDDGRDPCQQADQGDPASRACAAWSATSISSPRSAPARFCATCSLPATSRGCAFTQIFRQAQQSGIIVNAHCINHGRSRRWPLPPRRALPRQIRIEPFSIRSSGIAF
jgi:hypothetical protein